MHITYFSLTDFFPICTRCNAAPSSALCHADHFHPYISAQHNHMLTSSCNTHVI